MMVVGYVYDAAERLQFFVKPDGNVVAYEWDGNGNMTARTEGNLTSQFEYDYDNRLVRIVYPDGSEVRYGYDGLGRRVFRQEGNVVRYFFYDGDELIAERENGQWVVRHLLGAKREGFVRGGEVYVSHADRLGSIRWVTDGGQNIVVRYVYEGFGKVVGQEGMGGGAYQWCGIWGYRNDQDAGLMHVGARYYEVETGRWVQKDPIMTLNPYTYAINNPINSIDPNGTAVLIAVACIEVLVVISFGIAFGYAAGVMIEEVNKNRRPKEEEHIPLFPEIYNPPEISIPLPPRELVELLAE